MNVAHPDEPPPPPPPPPPHLFAPWRWPALHRWLREYRAWYVAWGHDRCREDPADR